MWWTKEIQQGAPPSPPPKVTLILKKSKPPTQQSLMPLHSTKTHPSNLSNSNPSSGLRNQMLLSQMKNPFLKSSTSQTVNTQHKCYLLLLTLMHWTSIKCKQKIINISLKVVNPPSLHNITLKQRFPLDQGGLSVFNTGRRGIQTDVLSSRMYALRAAAGNVDRFVGWLHKTFNATRCPKVIPLWVDHYFWGLQVGGYQEVRVINKGRVVDFWDQAGRFFQYPDWYPGLNHILAQHWWLPIQSSNDGPNK